MEHRLKILAQWLKEYTYSIDDRDGALETAMKRAKEETMQEIGDWIHNEVIESWQIKYPIIDSVMGLPRGGLIPAVMISHELNLPFVLHPGKKYFSSR